MITEEKLQIYSKYGEIDSWVRSGSKKEKSIMEDQDWYIIESLLQDLFFVNKGISSSEFETEIFKKLAENCQNERTISILKKMAESR
jgi:hypothetical protein